MKAQDKKLSFNDLAELSPTQECYVTIDMKEDQLQDALEWCQQTFGYVPPTEMLGKRLTPTLDTTLVDISEQAIVGSMLLIDSKRNFNMDITHNVIFKFHNLQASDATLFTLTWK